MGFQIGTLAMLSISKKPCKHILGQIMNLNYLIWMLSFLLVEQICFAQSHVPIPPKLSHVAPPTMITLSM
jgi:hypothetical protein